MKPITSEGVLAKVTTLTSKDKFALPLKIRFIRLRVFTKLLTMPPYTLFDLSRRNMTLDLLDLHAEKTHDLCINKRLIYIHV